MTIGKWDPFGNITALQGRINRMFEEAFPHSIEREEDMRSCAWRPLVDIYESDEGLVILAELPGVSKGDVSIEVRDNVLTLKGERRIDTGVADDQYYRRERSCGSFHRAFTLFENIKPELIQAKFKEGILRIIIPRPEEPQPTQVSVAIE